MILVLRVIKRQDTEEGAPAGEAEAFVWLRPAVRVQHQETGDLASPFGLGKYAVWVYEEIGPDNQKANKQRMDYVLVPTRLRRKHTLLTLLERQESGRTLGAWQQTTGAESVPKLQTGCPRKFLDLRHAIRAHQQD